MNTDGDFQYIIALEIIAICRLDSKTPPGTLGCQLQCSTTAKVTGLLPYGQPGNAEQSCCADRHTGHTSGQNWPEHRLFPRGTRGDKEGGGLSTVTNLLALLLEGQVKATHPTLEGFRAPAF